MAQELVFTKPKKLLDATTNETYFHFEQSNAETDYNVMLVPEDTFVVPDDVLTSIFECYLQFASSYFVKPPSIEQMKKHAKHIFKTDYAAKGADVIYTMYVSAINVFSKKTELEWTSCKMERKEVGDHIPSDFLTQSRPSSPGPETKNVIITSDPVTTAIMEAVADIPLQGGGKGENAFRLDDDSEERMYRLKVLEAKLSAKIAKYRVKKEEDKYYSRFGRLPPDEDEYDEDETDYETEED
jgi:hypothetical protein